MKDDLSNVYRVRFPQKKRPKRKGLALTFGAGDGHVFIAASGRQRYTIKEVNALIRELRDVRDDAKERQAAVEAAKAGKRG